MRACSVVSNSFATPGMVGLNAPLSMGFPRQEYWTGLPFSSPGDLPDPGIEPKSPVLQAEALTSMNTHRHTGIYCRSMTLCNCGSWSSSMCKSVIFPFDVGACGHRTDREGKSGVGQILSRLNTGMHARFNSR